jgi:cell wall-associated NlpC family hydrolase
MRTFFDTVERKRVFRDHCLAWLGTPFVPHARVLGAGVDCVQLCGAVYIWCGVVRSFDPPQGYPMDGGHHADHSTILDYLAGQKAFARLPDGAEVACGDLLCFRIGRQVHHCGLALDDSRFVHALRRLGVIESLVEDPQWANRLTDVWRPLAPTSDLPPLASDL